MGEFGSFRLVVARLYEKPGFIVASTIGLILLLGATAALLPAVIHPGIVIASVALVGALSILWGSRSFESWALWLIFTVFAFFVLTKPLLLFFPGAVSGFLLSSFAGDYFDRPNVIREERRASGIPPDQTA